MNFELENLFKFQELINSMQETCLKIKDPTVRKQAIERIDQILEIYGTFSRYYYNAHFAQQKILKLEFELSDLREKATGQQEEIEKLLKSLQWDMETKSG